MSDYMDFLGNLRKSRQSREDDGIAELEQNVTDGEENNAASEQANQEESNNSSEQQKALGQENASEHEDVTQEEALSEQKPQTEAKRGRKAPSLTKKRHILSKNVVSTSKQESQDDSDMIVVDKYTDRFSSDTASSDKADGRTRKMGSYSEIRASEAQSDGKTRQISVSEIKSMQPGEQSNSLTDEDEDERAARLRAIAQSAEDDYEGEQLIMPGFSEKKQDERTPEDVELEEKLDAVRKERIKKFKLTGAHSFGSSLSGEQTRDSLLPGFLKGFAAMFEKYNTDFSPCEGDEFTNLAQRRNIFTGLVKVRRKTLIRLLIVGAIGIILLLTNIIASAAASPAGALTVFGGSALAYTIFNLVLFLAVCFVCCDEVKKGFISLLQIRPKAQGAAVLLSLAVIAQCVGAFFTEKSLASEAQLFTGAAALLYVILLYSKVFCYDNARHCFKSLSSGGEKSVVRRGVQGDGITELVNDRDKKYSVVYGGKTSFITHFLERASRAAYAGMPGSRLIIAVSCASVIIGVIAAIAERSPFCGLSAAAFCMCLTFPVAGLFSASLLLARKNARLSSSGSYVQSFADARDFANSDYIVVDAHELFNVSLRDVTAFSGLNEKQASACAAALAISAGGTLGQAFSKKYGAYKDKLPEAQELSYEEKLGISAWVSECRMLLGTRQLLENHNVKLPSKSLTETFTEGDTQSVFMSVEERLAAMISLDYTCDAAIAEKLGKLAMTGVNIIVLTCDANINEHMVESKLNLPANTVRVVSSLAYAEFESAKQEVTPGENTGIVYGGGFAGLCNSAVTACSLDRMKRLSKIICAGGCVAGIIICAMIAISKSIGMASSLHAVIMQCVVLAVTFLFCSLSDSFVSPRRKKQKTAGETAVEPSEPEPESEQVPMKTTETNEKGGFTGDIFKGLLLSDEEPKDVFPDI